MSAEQKRINQVYKAAHLTLKALFEAGIKSGLFLSPNSYSKLFRIST